MMRMSPRKYAMAVLACRPIGMASVIRTSRTCWLTCVRNVVGTQITRPRIPVTRVNNCCGEGLRQASSIGNWKPIGGFQFPSKDVFQRKLQDARITRGEDLAER